MRDLLRTLTLLTLLGAAVVGCNGNTKSAAPTGKQPLSQEKQPLSQEPMQSEPRPAIAEAPPDPILLKAEKAYRDGCGPKLTHWAGLKWTDPPARPITAEKPTLRGKIVVLETRPGQDAVLDWSTGARAVREMDLLADNAEDVGVVVRMDWKPKTRAPDASGERIITREPCVITVLDVAGQDGKAILLHQEEVASEQSSPAVPSPYSTESFKPIRFDTHLRQLGEWPKQPK